MGDLFAVLSASCFAAANVTIARGVLGKGKDNGAFLSILLTAGIAAIVWIIMSLGRGWTPVNAAGLMWFAAAGVLTVFVGRVFLYASVQHLGAVRASAMKRLNPFFAVVLGVLLLGEGLNGSLVIGMLLIFSSFGVLVWQALRNQKTAPVVIAADAAAGAVAAPAEIERTPTPARLSWMEHIRNLGFFYGPISSLAYALGYVARKHGMMTLPDAAFGTMFGALVGMVAFLIAAIFIDSYRAGVRGALSFNPWLFGAGVLSSGGQIFYFMALTTSTITRVAMITSLEVFVTIFFSIVFLKARDQLTRPVLLACALGVIGTGFIMLQ